MKTAHNTAPSTAPSTPKNPAWNQQQTQRMLQCPVNRAVVDCVRHAPATRVAIRQHLVAVGLDFKSDSQIDNMVTTRVLRLATAPGRRPVLYAPGERAALFGVDAELAAPPADPVAPVAADVAPGAAPAAQPWVGYRVPPRQYDVMRAPAWVPPANHPARPGAGDFLQCQSRGHRC